MFCTLNFDSRASNFPQEVLVKITDSKIFDENVNKTLGLGSDSGSSEPELAQKSRTLTPPVPIRSGKKAARERETVEKPDLHSPAKKKRPETIDDEIDDEIASHHIGKYQNNV